MKTPLDFVIHRGPCEWWTGSGWTADPDAAMVYRHHTASVVARLEAVGGEVYPFGHHVRPVPPLRYEARNGDRVISKHKVIAAAVKTCRSNARRLGLPPAAFNVARNDGGLLDFEEQHLLREACRAQGFAMVAP